MRNEAKDKLVSFALSLVLLVEMRKRRGGAIAAAPYSDAYLQASGWWGEPTKAEMDEIVEGLSGSWECAEELVDWYTQTK